MVVSVKLNRYRDHYNWQIDVQGKTAEETIAQVQRIDDILRELYGADWVSSERPS